MIISNIELIIKCLWCQKECKYSDDEIPDKCDIYSVCENCIDDVIPEYIKQFANKILEEEYWKAEEFFEGFDSEKEKKCFMRGIKEGIKHSLFRLVEDYEGYPLFNKIEDIIEKIK